MKVPQTNIKQPIQNKIKKTTQKTSKVNVTGLDTRNMIQNVESRDQGIGDFFQFVFEIVNCISALMEPIIIW